MRSVQITIVCTEGEKEIDREREREKVGTQVLILPIMERKSFNVNRNIIYNIYKVNYSHNNEKNATKNKTKKHLQAFTFFPFINNEN